MSGTMLRPRSLSLAVLLSCAFGLVISCMADDDTPEFRGVYSPGLEAWVPSPIPEAYCQIYVEGTGWVDTETDYLPHVITCENGGANLEALKAQAIAARSVAYYSMANGGSICDGQGCQVYSCGASPSAMAYQAVTETSGVYLNFNNVLTYAFYVAGDPNTAPPSCVGTPGVGTEGWVTYNEGQSGSAVEQTELGWVFDVGEPGYGQNRGCMSQWGARCLENSNGYDYADILRFFYGADINMTQAQGSCVMQVGDGDGDTDTGTTDSGTDTTTESTGDEGWTTDDGTLESSDDGTCTIGSLGCICTQGGGCDPGLVCEAGFCVPNEPSEDSGEGASDGDSADEIGDDQGSGLPPGFSDDRDADGCSVTGSPRDGSALLLLALFGLAARRRRT